MGRLLGEFVDRDARSVTPALRQDMQVLLSERHAGWEIYGSASPDGEETANFFDAWPDPNLALSVLEGLCRWEAGRSAGGMDPQRKGWVRLQDRGGRPALAAAVAAVATAAVAAAPAAGGGHPPPKAPKPLPQGPQEKTPPLRE